MNKAMTMVLAALAAFAGLSEDVRTDPAGNVYARFGSLDRWNSFVATNVVEGLPRSGGDMTGPLNMGFNPITFNGSTNSSEWALWDMLRVWPTGAEGPVSLSFFITNVVAKEVGGVLDDHVYTKAESDAIITAVSNRAEEAYSAAEDKAYKSDLEAHVWNYENPHKVTAAQVGALSLVEDANREKTAVTIGSRSGTVGPYSLANGNNVTASGQGTHAEGLETVASGVYSRADGMFTEALGPGSYALGYMTKTLPSHRHAFVWNGYGGVTEKYPSKGEGTFNINPIGGVNGFYIGEKKLSEEISDGVAGKADKTNVYTKAEVDAKVDAVGSKADEAYSSAEQMVSAVNSLSGTVGTHTRDTKNPHKVTAAQVGALPLNGGTLTGDLAVGEEHTASRKLTVASESDANGITLQGGKSNGNGSSVFVGGSTGSGGSIRIEGGGAIGGRLYVGNISGARGGAIEVSGTDASIKKGGKEVATESYVDAKVENAVLPTDPTFSNAVLAVGLNIDTNSVAVLNDIAATFGGFPIGETATTVGGLLAALAAAVAWLKKNKVQTIKLNDGSVEKTAENGVAKLDDFFTESNSLLTSRVNSLIDAKVGNVNAVLAAALDGTEVA